MILFFCLNSWLVYTSTSHIHLHTFMDLVLSIVHNMFLGLCIDRGLYIGVVIIHICCCFCTRKNYNTVICFKFTFFLFFLRVRGYLDLLTQLDASLTSLSWEVYLLICPMNFSYCGCCCVCRFYLILGDIEEPIIIM